LSETVLSFVANANALVLGKVLTGTLSVWGNNL
jgi:hypothetical protein